MKRSVLKLKEPVGNYGYRLGDRILFKESARNGRTSSGIYVRDKDNMIEVILKNGKLAKISPEWIATSNYSIKPGDKRKDKKVANVPKFIFETD